MTSERAEHPLMLSVAIVRPPIAYILHEGTIFLELIIRCCSHLPEVEPHTVEVLSLRRW